MYDNEDNYGTVLCAHLSRLQTASAKALILSNGSWSDFRALMSVSMLWLTLMFSVNGTGQTRWYPRSIQRSLTT